MLQRLAVAASCAIFYFLKVEIQMARGIQYSLLATLALLACMEKLCSIMNMVSVERDWVRTELLEAFVRASLTI